MPNFRPCLIIISFQYYLHLSDHFSPLLTIFVQKVFNFITHDYFTFVDFFSSLLPLKNPQCFVRHKINLIKRNSILFRYPFSTFSLKVSSVHFLKRFIKQFYRTLIIIHLSNLLLSSSLFLVICKPQLT